jgi:thioredoxin-related protein
LDNEVFKSKEFAEYARKNLVLVRADFPRRIKQSEELKEANLELRKKYVPEFRGYPTNVVLDKEGEKLDQLVGYRPKDEFLAKVKEAAEK